MGDMKGRISGVSETMISPISALRSIGGKAS
jgi:hypothetical protein